MGFLSSCRILLNCLSSQCISIPKTCSNLPVTLCYARNVYYWDGLPVWRKLFHHLSTVKCHCIHWYRRHELHPLPYEWHGNQAEHKCHGRWHYSTDMEARDTFHRYAYKWQTIRVVASGRAGVHRWYRMIYLEWRISSKNSKWLGSYFFHLLIHSEILVSVNVAVVAVVWATRRTNWQTSLWDDRLTYVNAMWDWHDSDVGCLRTWSQIATMSDFVDHANRWRTMDCDPPICLV